MRGLGGKFRRGLRFFLELFVSYSFLSSRNHSRIPRNFGGEKNLRPADAERPSTDGDQSTGGNGNPIASPIREAGYRFGKYRGLAFSLG